MELYLDGKSSGQEQPQSHTEHPSHWPMVIRGDTERNSNKLV